MRDVTLAKLALPGLLLVMSQPAFASTFWPQQAKPLTRAQVVAMRAMAGRPLRTGVVIIDDQIFRERTLLLSGFSATPWPKGEIIYSFQPTLTVAQKRAFLSACDLWKAVAKVSCVLRGNQPDYVLVSSSTVNNADIGKPNGVGEINILSWGAPYRIAHEIGHSLGLNHEQCRSDRDTYVGILTANIIKGKEHNFKKEATVNQSVYDFDSVMHYPGDAFGTPVNGVDSMTIRVKPPNEVKQNVIGQRSRLSTRDGTGMAKQYGDP